MTNQEKLREVFPGTIFIYQKQGDTTCAIMCSDEWLDAEYTELNSNKDGVKPKRETVTEFADRCRECGREKVLDKIRAEIDQKQYDFMANKDYDEGIRFGLMLAYQIIDKYKVESEG